MSEFEPKSNIEKGRNTLVGKRDADMFAVLYFLTSGSIPSKNKLNLLETFADLTLYQSTGRFDSDADLVSSGGNVNQRDIIKAYWNGESIEKLKEFYRRVDEVYPRKETPEQNTKVKRSLVGWYSAENYWESKVRGINPDRELTPRLIVSNNNPICAYRESTNLAYVKAMLSILDPEMSDNEDVLKQVFLPVLMTYQVVTDFAQSGLPDQKLKLTMDKLKGVDYENLVLSKRIPRLIKDCADCLQPYIDQIRFPKKITGLDLRQNSVKVADYIVLAMELYKYQVKREALGRYSNDY